MGPRLAARVDPDTRRGLRLTLIATAVFLVTVPFGVLLLEVATRGRVVNIDEAVAWHQNLDNHTDPDRVLYAQVLTQFGSTAVLVAVVAAAVSSLALRGHRRQALYVLITSAIGAIMNATLKAAVGRSRPHFDDAVAHALGKSFPSGHAMNSAVVYGAVIVVLWQPLRGWRWRVTLLGLLSSLVVGIAASRVVLTVHYVSDVVAGVVLGVALVVGSAAAFHAWQVDDDPSPVGGSDLDGPQRVGSVASHSGRGVIPLARGLARKIRLLLDGGDSCAYGVVRGEPALRSDILPSCCRAPTRVSESCRLLRSVELEPPARQGDEMDTIEEPREPRAPRAKPSWARRRLVTGALVAGAMLGSAGIAAAQTGSSTTSPPAATGVDGSQSSKATSNEDPAHEAGEMPEQEAAEDAGLGHRGGRHGSNEDPAHEATESPEREAAEHAGQGAVPSTAPSSSSSASGA